MGKGAEKANRGSNKPHGEVEASKGEPLALLSYNVQLAGPRMSVSSTSTACSARIGTLNLCTGSFQRIWGAPFPVHGYQV